LADGGGVGSYTGKAGAGGNAGGTTIDSVGGSGTERFGANGSAGGGGTIKLTSLSGSITSQLISASGGKSSAQQVIGGDGGNGGKKGGAGANIGSGTIGGAGGTIEMSCKNGSITLNGDVRANGSAGGDVNGKAGRGGDGALSVGGNGGTVGA